MKETDREPEHLRTAIKAMAKVSRAPFLEAKPIMELASKFELELELTDTNGSQVFFRRRRPGLF